MPDHRTKRVFALLREAKLEDRDARLRLFSWVICRQITTTNDLSHYELEAIVSCLATWQRMGELEEKVAKHSAETSQ